jgi:glycosyltransferase involved in cell wall biosynthesis
VKIGVYAIAKNEEANVADWFSTVSEASSVLLYDTGSTDKTVEIARDLGIDVYQQDPAEPFRFDTARNAALALCPISLEYLLMVDLDERVEQGWRDGLAETVIHQGRPQQLTVVRQWGPLRYDIMKLHSRYGWTWRRPVHEELSWVGPGTARRGRTDIVVEHRPDDSKQRSGLYIDLMRIGTREYPDDSQLAFWFGRELIWNGHVDEGRAELQRFLDIPLGWAPEKAKACELLARFADTDDDRHRWLLLGVAYTPWRREPWHVLAWYYQQSGREVRMKETVQRLLAVPGPAPSDYLTNPASWDDDSIEKEFL